MASDAGNLVAQGAAAYFTGGASLAGGGMGGGLSGGSTSKPASSRSGDASIDFGGFGGVNIGASKADKTTQMLMFGAGALVLLVLLLRRR